LLSGALAIDGNFVHCTAWGNGADAVLQYLARYVFRIVRCHTVIVWYD
jgi:hypothetical protein